MTGKTVTTSHRFRGPCSACGDGDTALKYHNHDSSDVYVVSVLLLCTECQQPIKATITTAQWIKAEWIGPAGECLACNQVKKREKDDA